MAKANKTTAAAPEAAQEAREGLDVSQDTLGQGTPPDAPQAGAGGVCGPEDLDELRGCQDEAELAEALFIEYAVTGCERLNLRQEPSTDAPVVALLPRDVGVFGADGPAADGWRQVCTGRLSGWVMDKYLAPLELPDDGG